MFILNIDWFDNDHNITTKIFVYQVLLKLLGPNKKNMCVYGNLILPKFIGET